MLLLWFASLYDPKIWERLGGFPLATGHRGSTDAVLSRGCGQNLGPDPWASPWTTL